ncbi:MAG: hypothetical protein ACRC41_07900 [Sarcina sp.]
MAKLELIFKEKYSKYIVRKVWLDECCKLEDGQNKILYFNEKQRIRIRASRVRNKIYTVKTTFGDVDIRDCVKNMHINQK